MQRDMAAERVNTSGSKLLELFNINCKISLLIVQNPGFERMVKTFVMITFASFDGSGNTRELSISVKWSRLEDLVENSTSLSRTV